MKQITKKTCAFCGKKGPWRIYVIWDENNPKVGTGKNKWWQCDECDAKDERSIKPEKRIKP